MLCANQHLSKLIIADILILNIYEFYVAIKLFSLQILSNPTLKLHANWQIFLMNPSLFGLQVIRKHWLLCLKESPSVSIQNSLTAHPFSQLIEPNRIKPHNICQRGTIFHHFSNVYEQSPQILSPATVTYDNFLNVSWKIILLSYLLKVNPCISCHVLIVNNIKLHHTFALYFFHISEIKFIKLQSYSQLLSFLKDEDFLFPKGFSCIWMNSKNII